MTRGCVFVNLNAQVEKSFTRERISKASSKSSLISSSEHLIPLLTCLCNGEEIEPLFISFCY